MTRRSTAVLVAAVAATLAAAQAVAADSVYAETGSGTVDEFRANDDGTLTELGVVGGQPAGIEGIASG